MHERSGSSWRGSEYIILENGDIDDSLRNMLRKKFCDDFAWDAYEAVGTAEAECPISDASVVEVFVIPEDDARVSLRSTAHKENYGAKAARSINAGEVLLHYAGTLLTEDELKNLYNDAEHAHQYIYKIPCARWKHF